MPEFSLARTFRNRGLLLQTGSQFSNSALKMKACDIAVLYQQGFSLGYGKSEMNTPHCFLEVIYDKNCDKDIAEIPSGKYECKVFSSNNAKQAYRKMLDICESPQRSLLLFVEYLDEKQNRYIEMQKLEL